MVRALENVSIPSPKLCWGKPKGLLEHSQSCCAISPSGSGCFAGADSSDQLVKVCVLPWTFAAPEDQLVFFQERCF